MLQRIEKHIILFAVLSESKHFGVFRVFLDYIAVKASTTKEFWKVLSAK